MFKLVRKRQRHCSTRVSMLVIASSMELLKSTTYGYVQVFFRLFKIKIDYMSFCRNCSDFVILRYWTRYIGKQFRKYFIICIIQDLKFYRVNVGWQKHKNLPGKYDVKLNSAGQMPEFKSLHFLAGNSTVYNSFWSQGGSNNL